MKKNIEDSINDQLNKESEKSKESDNNDASKADNIEEDYFKEDSLEFATMSLKEKIQHKKASYHKRTKDMTKKERIIYTIGYYKWNFIITLFIICCLGWTGKVLFTAALPDVLRIAIVNTSDVTTPQEYIPDAFREYYDLGTLNTINVYSDLSFSANEDPEAAGLTMTDYQKVGYYNMYNMIDVIIGDRTVLNLYISSDDTTAIDISMDEELYKQIEDHVVTKSDWTGVKNDGKPYTVAIDISGTEFAKKCNLSYGEAYLFIPSTKYKDNENTINLIKMIFGL